MDLRRVDSLAANALTWTHYSGWWVFDMGMLVLFGVFAAGFTLYRLRSAPRRGPPIASPREPLDPGVKVPAAGSCASGRKISFPGMNFVLFAAARTAHYVSGYGA